jgi:hypothetical protein
MTRTALRFLADVLAYAMTLLPLVLLGLGALFWLLSPPDPQTAAFLFLLVGMLAIVHRRVRDLQADLHEVRKDLRSLRELRNEMKPLLHLFHGVQSAIVEARMNPGTTAVHDTNVRSSDAPDTKN